MQSEIVKKKKERNERDGTIEAGSPEPCQNREFRLFCKPGSRTPIQGERIEKERLERERWSGSREGNNRVTGGDVTIPPARTEWQMLSFRGARLPDRAEGSARCYTFKRLSTNRVWANWSVFLSAERPIFSLIDVHTGNRRINIDVLRVSSPSLDFIRASYVSPLCSPVTRERERIHETLEKTYLNSVSLLKRREVKWCKIHVPKQRTNDEQIIAKESRKLKAERNGRRAR